jgi:hypothetical protein
MIAWVHLAMIFAAYLKMLRSSFMKKNLTKPMESKRLEVEGGETVVPKSRIIFAQKPFYIALTSGQVV